MTYYTLTFCDAFKCRTPLFYYYDLWGLNSCMSAAINIMRNIQVSAWCESYVIGVF